MLTLPDRQTQPQNDPGGFKVPTADEVLADVVYDHPLGITGQDSANEAQKIDQIRGYILERINGIQEMKALQKRHLAAAGKGGEILESGHCPDGRPLSPWDRQEVEGLMELDLARAEHCRAMIGHFTLSLRTFYAMLE